MESTATCAHVPPASFTGLLRDQLVPAASGLISGIAKAVYSAAAKRTANPPPLYSGL